MTGTIFRKIVESYFSITVKLSKQMVLLAGCETVKSAKKTTRRRKVLQPKRNLHPAETNTTARPTDFKGPPAFKVFIAQSKAPNNF
jgi:hypothetical protein